MQTAFRWIALAVALTLGLSALRTTADQTAPAPDVTAAAAIHMRVPAVELKQIALADVFDFLRDVAGINVYVNWPALEAAGVDRSAPVTLKLRNVPLKTVLDLTLREAAGGQGTLTWYVSDNIIHITTKELAGRQLVTRVFPVQDLLVDVPDFTAPGFNISGGGGGGGKGGGGQIQDNGNGGGDGANDKGTMEERGQRLVDLIKMLVQPDVWIENGGFSSIRYFNGTLVVTAPPDVLAQISR